MKTQREGQNDRLDHVHRLVKLGGDTDRMRTVKWQAHTGAGDSELGEAENLATLVEHLEFLLGVSVVGEGIHMRNHVGGRLKSSSST